jgi:hypothetical protein
MYKLPGIIILFLVASIGGYYLWQFGIDAAATFTADHPSFQADLKNTLDLQAGIGKPTFTRATIATVTDFEGLIKNVKSGEARFEGARRVENLLTYSEAFDNTAWGKSEFSQVNPDVSVSPIGTLSADKLVAQNSNGQHYLSRNITGRIQAFSIYAKAGEETTLQIYFAGGTSGNALFNLSNGTITSTGGGGVTSSMISVGDGWYRCSLSTTQTNNTFLWLFMRPIGTNWIGDGTSGIYLWGAQLEAETTASEYVSTNVKTSTPYHGANVDGVKYFSTDRNGVAIPDATLHGYVAEGSRTNLLLQSETLGTTWTTTASSITTNAVLSPSGAVSAEKLLTNTTSDEHSITQGASVTSGSAYTISFYAKASEETIAFASFNSPYFTAASQTMFDLVNGVAYPGASVTATIIALPNGWYRCTATKTATASGSAVWRIGLTKTTSNSISTGANTTDGLYIWGAQLEAGSFASSYIPTTTASVTRNGDSLTYPTAGNVDGTKGSSYTEVAHETELTNFRAVILSLNTTRWAQEIEATGLLSTYDGTAFGGSRVYTTNTSLQKTGSVWSVAGNQSTFASGAKGVVISFDGNMNVGANLGVGFDVGGTNNFYGTIRNMKIWKKALTDTQLTNMTSTNTAVSQSAMKTTTVGADGSSFQADLKSTLDLQAGVGKPTFTRATIATVTDFEGLIKNASTSEARFEGARRVENLLMYSEDLSNAKYLAFAGASKVGNVVGIGPQGQTAMEVAFGSTGGAIASASAIYYRFSGTANNVYTFSTWVRAVSGSTSLRISISNPSGVGTNDLTVDTNWKRIYYTTTGLSTAIYNVNIRNNEAGDTANIYTTGWQLEEVTGQANQKPSEYVSVGVKTSAPYHGANVDGVKYFTTYNGNTTASNVVTEATGANIPDATLHGYVAEGARTNLFLRSEEFNLAQWSKVNSTLTSNSLTAPNGSSTVYKLVMNNGQSPSANDASGIYFSDLSALSSDTRTFSIFVKAGELSTIRARNNSTGTNTDFNLVTGAITGGDASVAGMSNVGNGWYRLYLTKTANTIYYQWSIRSSVTGDGTSGFYIWGAQLEAGSFASSYIPTTTASVARNADVLTYPTAGNVDGTKGTAYAEVVSNVPAGTQFEVIDSYTGAGTGIPMLSSTGNFLVVFDNVGHVLSFGTMSKPLTSKTNMATKWWSLSSSGFINGSQSGTTQVFSGNIGFSSSMGIGVRADGTLSTYGTIRNVKIWKKALTDTELTNMTSTNTQVSQSAVKKTIINASQNTKLTSGLVGLWGFNGTDISGTTVYDRSGQGNNGTTTGGVTKTIGKVGQALSFNGTSGHVSVGDISSFNASTAFTVSAWVYKTGNSAGTSLSGTIAGKWDSPAGLGWFLECNDTDHASPNLLRFYISGVSSASTYSVGQVSNNAWHHILVKYDGVKKYIYIDGVLDTSPNTTGTPTTSTTYFEIGYYNGSGAFNNYFNGKIDEVRVYNRALSATEVKQLYNLGR